MKILYICLCGTYTDGFSYQDNVLSKYHRILDNDVTIITTQWKTVPGNGRELCPSGEYINEFGIKIVRLKTVNNVDLDFHFKRFSGLYEAIENESPNLIFIHGVQTWDIDTVVRYVKKHKGTNIVADNHADWVNSGNSALSLNVLHKLIYKSKIHFAEPYIEKFYGVVPLRVDFLEKVYGLPKEKCEYLPLGGDDDLIAEALLPSVRKQKRADYECENDIVIMTGGKIDHNKLEIIKLMGAVNSLEDNHLKLLVFGSVAEQYKCDFEAQLSEKVKYIGWKKSEDIYSEYSVADIIAFPGLHSVLWEQAVAMGKSCIFKYIEGFTHIDIGGNCLFFRGTEVEDYMSVIREACAKLPFMKENAEKTGMKYFSYKRIAEKVVIDAN